MIWLAWSNHSLERELTELRFDHQRLVQQSGWADRLAEEADYQRGLVAVRQAIADRQLRAVGLNLAKEVIAAGQPEWAQSILDEQQGHLPANDLPSRRDFAWEYLRSLARRELAVWGRHESRVSRMALSGDRSLIATGDESGRVQVRDVATRKVVTSFHVHRGEVRGLAFSRDNRCLAVASASPAGPEAGTYLHVHQLATGRLLARSRSSSLSEVDRLWFTADGREVRASHVGLPGLMGWDTSTSVEGPDGLPTRILAGNASASAVLGDGRFFYAVDAEGMIHRYESSTGEVDRSPGLRIGRPLALAVSRDERSLAWVTPSGEVMAWAIGGAAGPRQVARSSSRPDRLVLSPDGEKVLVVSGTREVRLLNLETGRDVEILPFNAERVGGIQFDFSPDGEKFVTSGGYQPGGQQPPTVRDANTGAVEKIYRGNREFSDALFGGDSQTLFAIGKFDLAEWKPFGANLPQHRIHDRHADESWAVAFSPDGRSLATGGDDHQFHVVDLSTGRRFGVEAHDSTVSSLVWHPLGKTIASASLAVDGNLKLWDAQTGKAIATLHGHTEKVRSIAFSPQGSILASAGTDRMIRFWDGLTGDPLDRLSGHDDVIRSVAFSRDGRLLASGSNDGTVRIWDVASRRPVDAFKGQHQVAVVAFSPDGSTLASADEGGFIHLRDATTWQVRRVIQSDDRAIRTMAFSPDGNTLAAAGMSNTIRLWDPSTGLSLIEIREGTSGQVNEIAFSPDGSSLAVADHSGPVLIYRGSSD